MRSRTVFIVGLLVLMLSCNQLTPASSTPPPAIPTHSPAPALPTPQNTAIPTSTLPAPEGCLRWDNVEQAPQGQEVCVFGDVWFGVSVEDGNGNIISWVIKFADDPTSFYFANDTLPFQFESGDCISVTGRLQLNDNQIPFIENGTVKRC